MSAIRVRLQWALAQLGHATDHLEQALQNAKDRGWNSSCVAAIEKALVQNEETKRLVGNIRAIISPTH